MTSAPSVSVITVVRNDLAGLRRTIDSVQDQLPASFEHIIWDGASTDGTPAWLADAASQLPKTRWTSKRDLGIYDAMNKAAALAEGDLLLFLNAGDTLATPDVVKWVSEDRSLHSWNWAYGCTDRWLDDRFVDRVDQRPFVLEAFIAGRQWIPHQATFVDRQSFERLEGYDPAAGLAADQDLLLRFALESPPTTWDKTIANFQLGGAHSLATPRQRELEWFRMRVKNLTRSPHAVRLDRVRTEARIWVLTARRLASPLKHRAIALLRRSST